MANAHDRARHNRRGGSNDYIKNYHDPHIKESRVGSFKAAATAHHMTTQGFASHVLSDKGDFSHSMVKKAQFAHNATEFGNGHPG